MTLQPPSEYISPDPSEQPSTQAPSEPRQEAPEPSTPQPRGLVRPRTLSAPPHGIDVVGGRSVALHRVVALDRLASGVGFLTVEWPVHQRGYDLLAVHDDATVSARGNAITIDLSRDFGRVLIATGTRGTTTISPSVLRLTTGTTQIEAPIMGGTSLGVWPRLTISKVDEFVVIRNELDPLSGTLTAVAGAYGYDERNFTLAKSMG